MGQKITIPGHDVYTCCCPLFLTDEIVFLRENKIPDSLQTAFINAIAEKTDIVSELGKKYKSALYPNGKEYQPRHILDLAGKDYTKYGMEYRRDGKTENELAKRCFTNYVKIQKLFNQIKRQAEK